MSKIMDSIQLVRVDDRLLHGQVTAGWVPALSINHIIVIDQEIDRNKIMRRVLTSSVHGNYKLDIYSVDKAVSVMLEEQHDKKDRILILVKSPLVLQELMNKGVVVSSINLGGMGMYDNRKPYFRNLSCSESEVQVITEMVKKGVEVYYQLVPEQKRIKAKDFVK